TRSRTRALGRTWRSCPSCVSRRRCLRCPGSPSAPPLLRQLSLVVEIGTQRVGDKRRQRPLALDGVMCRSPRRRSDGTLPCVATDRFRSQFEFEERSIWLNTAHQGRLPRGGGVSVAE